ncbi:extracellular calcium-sensing receptor-like [Zootoca vivipara]|uniref:extracellular calcium-sensing receptor-like n=1 Tax=Zootoca vivipara TaxID=8524 RepID=UPI00293BAD5D|nr:extracellular calcium-sensing receptor-like [Zootoca vivipara]
MNTLFLGLPFFMLVVRTDGCQCQLPALRMEAFERRGDILIGGLFPLHHQTSGDAVAITFMMPPKPTYCHMSMWHQQPLQKDLSYTAGTVNGRRPSSLVFWFYKFIQTMVFAIEEINQDSSLLPNITLGFQIFDSCQILSRALLGATQFIAGGQNPTPNFHCGHTPPQAGLIGEAGITESRTIARWLDLYKYPQISYFATGPVADDGSQFRSFFRTIPSNRLQALGLARLVTHFAWTWLLDKPPGVGNVERVAREVAGSKSQVIVTFCGSEAQPLLLLLHSQGVTEKVWLCSEAMSHITFYRNQQALLMLSGSLAMSARKQPVPGLRDFIVRLHPSTSPEDIFIQEFWGEVFHCWWDTSSEEGGNNTSHSCTGKENLGDGKNAFVSMMGFGLTFNIHNAVYAIAHALHDMAQEEPRGLKRTKGGVPEIEPWKLLHYLRKVRFKNKVGEEVSFDQHGDPPALFDVLNTRFPSMKQFQAVPVGQIAFSPSQGEELKVDDSAIMWTGGNTQVPVSVCTPSCPMGHHKTQRSDMATCCFECVPCASGEISNQTDSSACSRCPEDQWPDAGQTQCVPKRELFLHFHEPLGAGLASASICGSLLPVLILGLFVIHRGTPLVRANSRELSYLLLAGLVLSFLCCLPFLGRPTPRSCLWRQAAFGLTFALCLSCILAKTAMVVAAFRATSPGGPAKLWLASRTPRAVVLLGCLPQLLLCATWLATSPPSPGRDAHSIPRAISLFCDEGSPSAFWGMLAYLSLLAALSLAGAFLARNLPDAFNEAWLICFSLLGCLGVWLAFVPAYLTSRAWYTAATEAFAILASSSALLCGMFFPKCRILLWHPELNTRRFLMRRETHASA